MPRLTSENLTIEAFEERMGLQRRMFARNGVSVAALHAAKDLELAARQSVETCISCDVDVTCEAWLDSTAEGRKVPAFCPNRRLIAWLQEDGRSRPRPDD